MKLQTFFLGLLPPPEFSEFNNAPLFYLMIVVFNVMFRNTIEFRYSRFFSLVSLVMLTENS